VIIPGEFETSLSKITRAIRDLAMGGSNATGEAVLSAGAETKVPAPLCGPNALVLFSPLDADAAQASLFLQSTTRGSFVLGHAAGLEGRRVRYEVRKP
jgi:hypothetical protein